MAYDTQNSIRRQAFAFLQANPGSTVRELAAHVDRSVATASAMLTQMRRIGIVRWDGWAPAWRDSKGRLRDRCCRQWFCAMDAYPDLAGNRPHKGERYAPTSEKVHAWFKGRPQGGTAVQFCAEHPRSTLDAANNALVRLCNLGALRRTKRGYYVPTKYKVVVDGRGMHANSLAALHRPVRKGKVAKPVATTAIEQCWGWLPRQSHVTEVAAIEPAVV